jgi:phosphonate C-P lyase system protein PhnG
MKDPQPRFQAEGAALKDDVLAVAADLSDRQAAELLALVDDPALCVVAEPSVGLVMMTVTDSLGTDFHLGEVLVTTAEVSCGGPVAHAMVMDDAPHAAVLAAAAEAIGGAGRQDLAARLREGLAPVAERIRQERGHEDRLVASTRVAFESMNEENVDFGSLG